MSTRKTNPQLVFVWVVALLVFALSVAGFVFLLQDSSVTEVERDHAEFRTKYASAPDDHIFRTLSAEEANSMIERGHGVLFLGFPECPWCQTLVPHLDASAKDMAIAEIQYFDIRQDRADDTELYQKFVEKLEPYLDQGEDGKPRIFVPNVVILRNGEVVGNYKIELPESDEPVTPQTYWNDETIATTRAKLRQIMSEL